MARARPVPRPARAQVLDADTLEEKVFLMQVFYERLIIPRFRMIARSSRGTVLEDLCNRLTIDDGIHHGAGMAYERVLLEGAGKKIKNRLDRRCEPAAADLREARAVAAEGARVHRRADARDGHPHAEGRPRAGRPPRAVARHRRERHRASLLTERVARMRRSRLMSAMCFDLDSTPPIPRHLRRGRLARELVLAGAPTATASRAFLADARGAGRDRGRDPARRSRPVPLLRGARAALRRARVRRARDRLLRPHRRSSRSATTTSSTCRTSSS